MPLVLLLVPAGAASRGWWVSLGGGGVCGPPDWCPPSSQGLGRCPWAGGGESYLGCRDQEASWTCPPAIAGFLPPAQATQPPRILGKGEAGEGEYLPGGLVRAGLPGVSLARWCHTHHRGTPIPQGGGGSPSGLPSTARSGVGKDSPLGGRKHVPCHCVVLWPCSQTNSPYHFPAFSFRCLLPFPGFVAVLPREDQGKTGLRHRVWTRVRNVSVQILAMFLLLLLQVCF